MRTSSWHLGLVLILACLGACAHPATTLRTVAGAKARIGHVDIHGNAALDDRTIREHMNLQPTKWFPLPKRQWYLPGLVPVDTTGIEAFYASAGFHDARVVSFEPKFRRRGKVVDLHIEVEEHDPTRVRKVHFAWPDGGPTGDQAKPKRPSTGDIERHCGLTPGKPFDVAELRASEATMRIGLAKRGYAFASVVAEAQVDRVGHTADVVFTLRPGPFVRIGEIAIQGRFAAPLRAIRTEVDGFVGRPWSPTRMQELESAVYSLDLFSSVTVTAADTPRTTAAGEVVDVTIEVVESPPQSVRLGVGLGIDPNRWEQFGELQYSHTNIDRHATRFDLRVQAGYAEIPTPWVADEHGPIGRIAPSIRRKGWLEKKLVWTLAPTIELGIQRGYQYYSPSLRAGVSRFFTRFFELDFSYNLRFVDFFSVDKGLDSSKSLLGLDFRDPYSLSYIELTPRVHLTDRLLDPQHGVVLGVTWNLAGGIFGGNYDYNRLTPDLRAYWTPIRNRLQFAARGQLGLILPFGDEPGAPFDLKYYLGGSNTVRGYGYRRIAPSVEWCSTGNCRFIPVGGNTMVSANAEARVRVVSGLWLVLFADMGDIRSGVREFAPTLWSYTMGPGIRYHTKIGVLRLDGGFRLNDGGYGRGQPIGAVHFGLGEAF